MQAGCFSKKGFRISISQQKGLCSLSQTILTWEKIIALRPGFYHLLSKNKQTHLEEYLLKGTQFFWDLKYRHRQSLETVSRNMAVFCAIVVYLFQETKLFSFCHFLQMKIRKAKGEKIIQYQACLMSCFGGEMNNQGQYFTRSLWPRKLLNLWTYTCQKEVWFILSQDKKKNAEFRQLLEAEGKFTSKSTIQTGL